MTDSNMPDSDFDWLADVYNSQGAMNHPSELHGLALGEMAGGLCRSSADWIALVQDHMGVDELNVSKQTLLVDHLIEFYQQTEQAIERDSSAFELLLPDDGYALSDRVTALSIWVRGFLEGLAIAAGEQLAKVDSHLHEIIRDFVEISQLDEQVGCSEAEEREFFEVCEFVRIGVLNLYAEFNQPHSAMTDGLSTPGGHTLH